MCGICVHMCKFACIHVYMPVHVCMHMGVCMFMCACVCLCICGYICACMHVHRDQRRASGVLLGHSAAFSYRARSSCLFPFD